MYIDCDVKSLEFILLVNIFEEMYYEILLPIIESSYLILERGGYLGFEFPIKIGPCYTWIVNYVK